MSAETNYFPTSISQKSSSDASNFDPEFTMERVALSRTDKDVLDSINQKQFRGFSFTNPKMGN